MTGFVMRYMPNWIWDVYRWVINHNRARAKYRNPLRYMAFQRAIRRSMWGK